MTSPILYILDSLKDSLLGGTALSNVYYLARIDDEGRVLIPIEEKANEFKALSPSDTENAYAYIRHLDGGNIFSDEILDGRKLSCYHKKFNIRYELRLVAVMKNVEPYWLEDKLRAIIAKTQVDNLHEYQNIKFVPKRSIIDSIAVVKEESPKPKQFDKNLIFVAIDFDLSYEMNYY